MATEKRLVNVNDVYSLFDRDGTAKLHVADIDLIPRVDAVEVVRCKDCKHFRKCSIYAIGNFCVDDFCAYGERKDNA